MKSLISDFGSGCFTLLELVVVLGLLGMLLSVAMPALAGFSRGRQIAEHGRQLLAMTRYAQAEAISSGDVSELWIDAEEGSYGVRTLVGEQDDNEGREFALPESLEFALEDEHEGVLETASVLWLPDGSRDAADLSRVLLRHRSGDESGLVLECAEGEATYTLEAEE